MSGYANQLAPQLINIEQRRGLISVIISGYGLAAATQWSAFQPVHRKGLLNDEIHSECFAIGLGSHIEA